MDNKPAFETAAPVKIMINIGALMDIPTGMYLFGRHGESILNGGLGFATGVVGIGNNFKSTVMHYMMLSAMDKITYTYSSSLSTYDTEVNIHEWQLQNLTKRFDRFKDKEIINDGIWNITDKTMYYANEWYEIFKKFVKEKVTTADKNSKETPFLGRDKKTLLRIPVPTFSEVDSFTAFETEDVAAIQDKNELGDSGGNTIHMRQGLAKMRFLMEMPGLAGAGYNYIGLTAHVGKDIAMASGPMAPPPTKKLQHLKHGDKIKGVTDQFFFLLSNCWHAHNAAPFVIFGKGLEYPRTPEDNDPTDTDLNMVTIRQLRSKSGPTGYTLQLLVSQRDGVLPELTEFHFIKEHERYGISGSLQHYALDLYPDVKIQRTSVRSKIDTDARLRRALNITSQMLQMKLLWRHLDPDIICTPKELYDDLKAKGYDWDVLLDTRGWWTLDNDKQDIPFLSTMDLLRMRKELYFPYWMKPDKTKK